MKRALFAVLSFLFLALCACSSQKNGSILLDSDEAVSAAEISSLPDGYSFSFSGDDAGRIRDYLSGLHLKASFKERPETYGGMTWVIRLTYESGKTQTIYHFGNMFIRNEQGRWYKMEYGEAAAFENLIGVEFRNTERS